LTGSRPFQHHRRTRPAEETMQIPKDAMLLRIFFGEGDRY
jgi:hypothetical protein